MFVLLSSYTVTWEWFFLNSRFGVFIRWFDMKLNALGSIFAARSSLKQLITPAVVPTVLTTFNWWVAKPYQKICFYLMIRMAAFRRARAGVSACIQVQCVRQLLFSEYLLILYMTLQERGNKRKCFFVKVSWRWGDQFLYCVPKSALPSVIFRNLESILVYDFALWRLNQIFCLCSWKRIL